MVLVSFLMVISATGAQGRGVQLCSMQNNVFCAILKITYAFALEENCNFLSNGEYRNMMVEKYLAKVSYGARLIT